jgi:hypothetical protein
MSPPSKERVWHIQVKKADAELWRLLHLFWQK